MTERQAMAFASANDPDAMDRRLKEYAAELERRWREISDGERVILMSLCCGGCGTLDPGCQCRNDE